MTVDGRRQLRNDWLLLGAFFFNGPGLALAPAQPFFFKARPGPGPGPAVLFRGPGGPKLALPLPSAVIGHAHLPHFSCFANGVGKRCER